MRCPRCGNENPGTNRFCGMCGATLLQATPTPTPRVLPRPAPAVIGPSDPTAPLPATPASATPPAKENTPAVSGPSFLGLDQPAPAATRPRSSNPLSIDPNAAPSSRNLDYLLEDDEPLKRAGASTFILVLVALALAAGLGYLRWRNQGFGWLGSSGTKSSAATQNSGSGDSAASGGSGGSSRPGAATQPSGDTSSTGNSSAGNAGGGNANASPANTAPTEPASGEANSTTTNPAGTAATPSATTGIVAQPAPSSTSSAPASPTQASPSSAPASSASSAASDDSTSTDGAASTAKPAAEKPRPTKEMEPAKPVDAVAEAQKYIYGRGVPQNCDRGMRLLKPAVDRANPKAMIEMGAQYSSGLCTPRDLPTAYHWFAMALRKDPDNQSVQADLEKLWGEMTQAERQLAMRLNQ